jgi:hypothetical protein
MISLPSLRAGQVVGQQFRCQSFHGQGWLAGSGHVKRKRRKRIAGLLVVTTPASACSLPHRSGSFAAFNNPR